MSRFLIQGYPSNFGAKHERQNRIGQGSTDGVGRLVGRLLAGHGARVLIHGRDHHRGKQVVDQIQAAGHGSAVFLPADFSSLAEVRRLADLVRQHCDRLNVLMRGSVQAARRTGLCPKQTRPDHVHV